MTVLSEKQQSDFWRDGYLMLDDALSGAQLDVLNRQFDEWVELSREHEGNFGETIDGRARFSVQPGHSPEQPALRRIASPTELSVDYLDAMRVSPAVDAVTELYGPDLRFSNSKVNSKLPGAATEVKFHQDFTYELHSNDSLMSVLYFLDDVTERNGPLQVVPGTHQGPIYDLWHDGVFTGAVSDEIETWAIENSVSCTGSAGTACLMHTRLLHGSAPNLSNFPRTLFICAYNADDAVPLHDNHIPSAHTGEVIRGEARGHVRCVSFETEFAEMPTGASFFEQQAASTDSS